MVLNSNTFADTTNSSGIDWSRHRGDEAFSVAWIDYNNDGRQDLWISGHGYNNPTPRNSAGKFPALYINQGNGRFNNIFEEDWRRGQGGDIHGATWIDFDNDGDQDVFASGGGALGQNNVGQPNLFFVNNNGTLTNQASDRNITYDLGRSRSSLWVDVNGDGRLDVVQLVALRNDNRGPTVYFQQRPNGTFAAPRNLNLPGGSRYAQLADLTGDGSLEVVIQGTNEFPIRVFDISNGNFNNITNQFNFPLTFDPSNPDNADFFNRTSARDSIIADFDNDGDNDFFLTRSDIALSNQSPSVFRAANDIVVADLLNRGRQIGFSFRTTGQIALDISDIFEQEPNLNANQIFIGASGRNPTAAELRAFRNTDTPTSINLDVENTSRPSLVLNRNSNGVNGIAGNRSSKGIYIGFDNNSQTWQVRLSSNQPEIFRAIVESTANVTDVRPINFSNPNPASRGLTDQLWTYDSNNRRFVNRQNVGLNTPTLSQSAVAADFDNDKDIDIYIANSSTTINQPNILYENRGDGTFRTVEMAGGARGFRVGPSHLDFNIGARLATADYNNDGAVDIFVGSTTIKSPRKTYLGTPSQLFRNRGNGNNWILLDLEGVESNRDAIGAQVRLTSGGVTQLREQNGGIHVFAQNDQRLHFGLGQDNRIDRIEIRWPSGEVQTLNNVGVNQILRVREDGTTPPPPNPIPTPGENDDNIIGTNGADNLSGGVGNDTIAGRGGRDVLDGGTGNDILFGQVGIDTLSGGAGADNFRYTERNHRNDVITDFQPGQDTIQISASGFGGGLTPGNVSAGQFVLGNSATDGNDRFLYNANNGRVLFDPDGTGSAGKIVIATLENRPDFDNGDLEII